MSKQDFLKTQSCVLRLNIDCDGCKTKVKKLLHKIDGVYTVNIDTEQGKVTVTGIVDPSVLIKKLEKHGKHAQLWGPSKGSSFHQSNNQFMNLNNQFKNLHFDGGKAGKDNNNFNNNNSKSQKGGGKDQHKGGGAQQQQLQHQQLLQQHQQFLQQQMKGAMGKDFKVPTNKKEQKSVKFHLPEDEFDDDEFDDDEFDDELDDEFGDEFDDEMEGHDMYGGAHGHHPQSKNIPSMGNGKGDNKKGKGGGGGGGGEKKGKGGSGGGAKKGGGGGGGGGMVGLFKGMLGVGGGKSDGKKGKDGKKDGKNGGGGNKGGGHHNLGGGGGKNGGGGHEGKMGKSQGGGNINHKGNVSNNGGGNNNNKSKGGKQGGGGGGGGGGHYFENDGINHGKIGGQHNIPIMGHPMGHNMPAAQPMMNAGGAYYQGMGPPGGPYGNNPQQQQYMAMMMNQQRMNGGDGYGMYQQPQPMMYGRPQMGMPYGAPMVPPPGYHDPFTAYFSDENTSSCSIM